MTNLETLEPSEYDEFETGGEFMAFVFRNKGEAFVREFLALGASEPVPPKPWLLSQAERIKIVTHEGLERDACEVERAGLKKLAGIIREYVAERPSELDVPPYEPGTVNHRAWLASRQRRLQRQQRRKLKRGNGGQR